jgi:hypothetical protein
LPSKGFYPLLAVSKLPALDKLTFDGLPIVAVAELLVALYFLGLVPLARLLTNEHPRKWQLALRFLSLLSKNFPTRYCQWLAICLSRLLSSDLLLYLCILMITPLGG